MNSQPQKKDAILVLDFGGQYAHLIARRIREQKVYSEVVPCEITFEEINSKNSQMNVRGLILSGGPASVYGMDAPSFNIQLSNISIPILGICYGHQLIAMKSQGQVTSGEKNEYGMAYVTIDNPSGILEGLSKIEKVWMSHGDIVVNLSKDYEALAHSENCPIAAFQHRTRQLYGVQWHPEVVQTEKGILILKNYIFNICKCRPNWIVEDYIQMMIREVNQSVGTAKAIVALSGGVDSSVVAAIASKAIGKNLNAILVDHGFLRENEIEEIQMIFDKFEMNLIILDEKKRFLEKLCHIIDPEEKRKIIGEEFIRAFERKAEEFKADYLIQGTIYPDRIESGFKKHSDKIKTHHNVGGLPDMIRFKAIVEPIRDLYKDEVRLIAKRIGLPKEIWSRQPFPGPGLAVRIIGEITQEKLDVLKKADSIVTEEIKKSGLENTLWQFFAVLTNTKSTGIRGDTRTYGYTIVIRAVESLDGMTASFARVPYQLLEQISSRLTNEIPQIARVTYDITHKPPATIEWE